MYLLDTHILLWYFHNDKRLSERAKNIINENDVAVSVASLWEIAIKKTIGKLSISESITDLERECIKQDIVILPITTRYLEIIQKLPTIHNDPFDRLLIATAFSDRMIIITDDNEIKKYNIDQIC